MAMSPTSLKNKTIPQSEGTAASTSSPTKAFEMPGEYEPLLMQVDRPGRYVGGEWNATVKDPQTVRATIALAFPDVYDLGMSYHGYRLLYERINNHADFSAERVYTPWPDFGDALRAANLPLTTLETYRPLHEMDIVGFTLQNELNYTNVLEMLDLGGIPLRHVERDTGHPLIIGGGEGAFSPECLADFFDVLALGDGEEIVFDILEAVADGKQDGLDRSALLQKIAQIPGAYVPSLYNMNYNEDGTIASVEPIDGLAPPMVYRRLFNISKDLGSVQPVVPIIRTVQNRTVVEVRRGCVNGCRFCQAGMITRPIRERSVSQIEEIVRQNLTNTGDDSVTLLSLSTADYSAILPTVQRLNREWNDSHVSFSLPSLKISAFDVRLAKEISRVRRSSFTFAPEAGSERLRAIINKPLDEDQFRNIIEQVLLAGWRTIKMYFMIGLPGEEDSDLDGIVEIASFAQQIARKNKIKGVKVNVSISPFSPKSHTPFQWHGQISLEEMERRCEYVRSRMPRNVSIKTSPFETCVVEASLSRGDRRLCKVVERAWRSGCRFDGWSEHFRADLWTQAWLDEGLDQSWYAGRTRADDEIFPFDHLECGTGKDFLYRQMKLSRRAKAVDECVEGPCPNCDACGPVKKQHTLPNSEEDKKPLPDEASDSQPQKMKNGAPRPQGPPPVMRIRLRFSKSGPLRFIAHLDMAEALHRLLRRAGIPVSHTQGFNPKLRVSIAPPLSLGSEGQGELVDIMLKCRVDLLETLKTLKSIPLKGLDWHGIEEVPIKAPSLQQAIETYSYEMHWSASDSSTTSIHSQNNKEPSGLEDSKTKTVLPANNDDLQQIIENFRSAEIWPIKVMRKRITRTRDAKEFVASIQTVKPREDCSCALRLDIRTIDGATLNPSLILKSLLGDAFTQTPRISRLPLQV